MIVAKNITKADNNIYQVKRKEIFNIIFCTIHDLLDLLNAMYRIFENVFSIVNEIMISKILICRMHIQTNLQYLQSLYSLVRCYNFM